MNHSGYFALISASFLLFDIQSQLVCSIFEHDIILYSVTPPERLLRCALVGSVWPGHRVQVAHGSVGAGAQLLRPRPPPLCGSRPALSLCQLLPHLPSSAGSVPVPGQGRRSLPEANQREVGPEGPRGSFILLICHHREKYTSHPNTVCIKRWELEL